jgi:GNAT superfamily N-acetyltransferase
MVYVAPQYRRQGVATALIGRVEQRAAALGSDSLFLFTPESEALYAGLGWQLMEYSDHQGRRLAIMSKALG